MVNMRQYTITTVLCCLLQMTSFTSCSALNSVAISFYMGIPYIELRQRNSNNEDINPQWHHEELLDARYLKKLGVGLGRKLTPGRIDSHENYNLESGPKGWWAYGVNDFVTLPHTPGEYLYRAGLRELGSLFLHQTGDKRILPWVLKSINISVCAVSYYPQAMVETEREEFVSLLMNRGFVRGQTDNTAMLGFNDVFTENEHLDLYIQPTEKCMTQTFTKKFEGEKEIEILPQREFERMAEVPAQRLAHQLTKRMRSKVLSRCGPSLDSLTLPQRKVLASHSQAREDLLLLSYYFCKKNIKGTFVEIGAYDGKSFSNSYLYEKVLGWNGVLIEANPRITPKLKKNRGDGIASIFTMAVCPYGPNGEEGVVEFAGDPGTSGVVGDLSDNHREQWIDGAKNNSIIKVPCKPISAMIKEAGLDHIDIFSLDVEGGELSVLKTFDFDVPVCVFVVELDFTDPQKDESVRELLRSKGFRKRIIDNDLHCMSLEYRQKSCQIPNEYWENPKCEHIPSKLVLNGHELDTFEL
eukprot:m.61374 g.61374  ORF g.61374 m.61374 type:complete len:525 (+) comp11403_c0_seq4:229-1803(+)